MQNLKDYLAQLNEIERLTIDNIVSGIARCFVIGVGRQFESIQNYKKWGADEEKKIEHQPGQVLLIDYWANWYRPCIRLIKKKTKMLKQNAEKWGNKVRFVSLSLALAEDAKKFMDAHQESQTFIEYYFPKEKKQSDTLQYGYEFPPPHYVVVDQSGIIRKTGYVNDIEKLVNSLLNEQVSPTKEEHKILKIDPNKIQQILNSDLFAQADPQKILEFEILLKSKPEGNISVIQKSELTYFARDTQEQQLQPILSQLFEIIPEQQWVIKKKIQKTVSIPYPGKGCSVCQKNISNEPQQYYSPFKQEYICTECAEADNKEKVGNERYKYLDTLIFINGPLSDPSVLQNIDKHKIGKNKKLPNGEVGSQKHLASCNFCEEDVIGPRYISVTARPGKYQSGCYIDFCYQCFLYLKDKTSEKAQEIVAKYVDDGMILDSLFTRVLFNYGGYGKF